MASVVDVYPAETESPVPGEYADFKVTPTTFTWNTATKPITWINKFVFYMKWDDGNQQLFVYDTARNILFQNVNQIQWENVTPPKARTSALPAGAGDFQNEAKNLGDFRGVMVQDTHVGIQGSWSRNIAWVNPLTFYMFYGPGNEQVWTFDPATNGYIQFVSAAWSVRDGFSRTPAQVYTRIF